MTNDAEREVWGLILTTNAELVGNVLRRTTRAEGSDVLAAIAATRNLDRIVDDILHALVRQARAEGLTWAAIGDVLGVSRQAAFQRFGSADSGTAGEDKALMPLEGAEQRARELLECCLEQHWEELRAEFDERMKEKVSSTMLQAGGVRIAERFGTFLEMGTPAVTVRDGYTVVDVPLAFDHGDLRGRVVFNADGQVSGFFLRPIDAPSHDGRPQ
jgi:hypothetical protein